MYTFNIENFWLAEVNLIYGNLQSYYVLSFTVQFCLGSAHILNLSLEAVSVV